MILNSPSDSARTRHQTPRAGICPPNTSVTVNTNTLASFNRRILTQSHHPSSMPPKQTALQSRVRILEHTTESSMEKGKPYLFTTENISLEELGAQEWKVPRGRQYSPEIGGAGSHHHLKAGETKGRGHMVEARGKVSLPAGSWNHSCCRGQTGRKANTQALSETPPLTPPKALIG